MPLLGVVLALAVAGSGEPLQTVNLTYKEFKTRAWSGGNSFGAYQGSVQYDTDSAPKGAVNARTLQIEEYSPEYRRESSYSGIVAQSSSKAKGFDLLWVDWNGDGKYGSNERAVRTAAWKGLSAFKPKSTASIAGIHGPFRYLLTDKGTLTIEPAGCNEGFATFRGRKVRIGVVDGDLDGIARTGESPYGASDFLLVDYNLNGRFDNPLGETEFRRYAGESAPLGGKVLMPDKAYYYVRVSPTGKKLMLRKAPAPMGAVSMKGLELNELTLGSAGGSVLSRSIGGVCPVPAGTYREIQGYARKGGWTCSFDMSRTSAVVKVGQTLALVPATPRKLVLDVARSGESYTFNVDPKGSAGVSINGVYKPNGDQPNAPVLSIRNGAGKVIQGLAFEYG